jgi:hypothetical protein
MALIDLLRENTKEVRDTLAEIEKTRQRYVSERNAAEERFKRASSEISSHHKQQESNKGALQTLESFIRDINHQIDELEIQKQQLLAHLFEKQQELDEHKRTLSEAEILANKAQRAARDEQKKLEDIEHHLSDIDQQRVRFQNTLNEQHRRSLLQYLSDSSHLIETQFQEQAKRSESMKSLEAFKRARHDRRDVADLCDARDEWKRLLKTATVPAVRSSAEAELLRIESSIEKLFPGALRAESTLRHADYIEELYYFSDFAGNTYVLMPVTTDVWEAIPAGKQSLAETVAMYLFATIGKAIVGRPQDAHFRSDGTFVMLVYRGSDDPLRELNSIVVPLPGGGSITFILTNLPNEIQEALSK